MTQVTILLSGEVGDYDQKADEIDFFDLGNVLFSLSLSS